MKKIGWLVIAIIVLLLITTVVMWAVSHPPQNIREDFDPTTTDETAPTTTAASTDTATGLSFTGKVLEVDGDSVLMECYDKNKFTTVWVNTGLVGGIAPAVGEEYVVTYEDMMMPSLPPRITAVTMTLKKG